MRWAWRREDVRGGALSLGGARHPGSALLRLADPGDPQHRLGEPGCARAGARLRALHRPAERVGRPLLARPGGVRAVGRRRRGGASADPVCRPRLAPSLGGRMSSAARSRSSRLRFFPWLFTPFSDAVSLSQSRRLAGFIPFGFALAGGMGVLAALLGRFVAPLALVAGIVLQWQFPGDFGYTLDQGGPAWATWIAVVGALVALVLGFRRARSVETTAALASALLLLPTFVYGLSHWSTSTARAASPLTPGLVHVLREKVPAGAIVYSDPESSYQIAAAAPVYICNAPPGHVADTKRNHPYERRDQWLLHFNRTGDLAIPRACGATWLLIDTKRSQVRPLLPVAYRDGRYVLYRLPRFRIRVSSAAAQTAAALAAWHAARGRARIVGLLPLARRPRRRPARRLARPEGAEARARPARGGGDPGRLRGPGRPLADHRRHARALRAPLLRPRPRGDRGERRSPPPHRRPPPRALARDLGGDPDRPRLRLRLPRPALRRPHARRRARPLAAVRERGRLGGADRDRRRRPPRGPRALRRGRDRVRAHAGRARDGRSGAASGG